MIFGTCLPNDYELPSTITFNLNICTASANIVDANDISTNLTIESRLLSQSGKIDLSGSYTSLTLDGATLSANSFTGQGAAIDLSGANSLTFTGDNTLDAGSGSISLPSGFRISGTSPTATGTLSYATEQGAYTIAATPVAFPSAATGDISTSLNTLVISDDITSTTGKIDLTGATGSLTLDGATLSANSFTGQGAAIDLSGANSLTFTGDNTLDAGSGSISLPQVSEYQ